MRIRKKATKEQIAKWKGNFKAKLDAMSEEERARVVEEINRKQRERRKQDREKKLQRRAELYHTRYKEKINKQSKELWASSDPDIVEKREQLKEFKNTLYKKHKQKNPIKFLLSSCKNRARDKGQDFDIDAEYLGMPSVCPILGIPLRYDNSKPQKDSASVDRFDNSKGYVKGNAWIISLKANFMKNNATIEELEAFCNNFLAAIKERRSHDKG
jgi:hypothetical protein